MKISLFISLLAGALCISGCMNAEQLTISQDQVQSKRSAQANLDSKGILLKFNDPEWSAGMKLNPPDAAEYWDLSGWKILAVDVENLSSDTQMRLVMHIASGSKEAKTLREAKTGIALNPLEKRTMRLLLPHESIYKVPDGAKGLKYLDTTKIKSIEFEVEWPFEPQKENLVNCRLSNFRLEEKLDPASVADLNNENYFPFIDKYGQFVHADWKEKIHNDEDLRRELASENDALAKSLRPASWDRFGGWASGPQLQATGSFRTEKYDGKWYLVDPDGRLFFSHGLDVLYPHTDATKTKDHDKWFSEMPAGASELAFTNSNLKIKYAKDNYYADFYKTLSKRLEAWGFNTIGNWGKADFIALGTTPYVLQLTDFNSEWPGFQSSKIKFYDVFDPRFTEKMGNLLADRAKIDPVTKKSIDDPMCIGYFIDNELAFDAFIKGVMKAPASQPAKIEFSKDLQSKYKSIEALNAAWNSKFSSWADFLEHQEEPNSEGFRKDSKIFHAKAVERYFQTCRDGIKKLAPHRLYLGCRFVSFRQSSYIWDAAIKYCDIASVNTYVHTPANCKSADYKDRPIIIGEFHFGVYDRGMFSSSLCPAGISQTDRATAYIRFMQGALVHPNIVGANWFQFRDQPLTGRWDGEGYQIGFVDVADTPYKEMTEAARLIGENMYRYRAEGKLKNSMTAE